MSWAGRRRPDVQFVADGFDTHISNGILGSFWITPTGDTTLNEVTIQRVVGGKVTPYATIHVPDGLVASD